MIRRSSAYAILVAFSLAFACKSLLPDGAAKAEPKPAPGPAITSTLTVDPDRVLGPLSRVFRPSVMMTGAHDPAKLAYLSLPGQLGTVRWSLGAYIEKAGSADEYTRMLQAFAPAAKKLEDRGAELVICLEGMPRWLASRQEDELAAPYGWPIFKASPPRDLKAYQAFVYDTVQILNCKVGLHARYEFWNEPNSRMFWVGTQQQLFATYGAFAVGARRADPKAMVGGLAVGSWKDPREGEQEPLLRAFIRFAGSTKPEGVPDSRMPLDFVSWHCFARSPEEKWEGALEIRDWLSAAGYDPKLPQIVDEWNRWSTFPDWYDTSRDSHLGAAYYAAGAYAMDRAGVSHQSFATLQDFNDPPAGKVFIGDFGVLTRKPMVKKATFHVMQMMGMLQGTRVAASVPAEVANAEGVGVIATTGGNSLTLLIHRYGADETGALARTLRSAGFERASELGIGYQEVVDFITKKTPLPSSTPAKSRAALEEASKNAQKAKMSPASQVTLDLDIPGWEQPRRYTVYRVDETNANPGVAYALAIKAGQSQDQALAAARKMETLTPVTTGSGSLPSIPLGYLGVVLVILERS